MEKHTFMDFWLDEMFPIVQDDDEMELALIDHYLNECGEDVSPPTEFRF